MCVYALSMWISLSAEIKRGVIFLKLELLMVICRKNNKNPETNIGFNLKNRKSKQPR